MIMTERDALLASIEHLSDESLKELKSFVAYLAYKEGQQGSAWAKELYDYFAPVREAAAQSGMTDEEIDLAIDTALDEVRRE